MLGGRETCSGHAVGGCGCVSCALLLASAPAHGPPSPSPLTDCGVGWFQTVTVCRLHLVFLGFTVIKPGGPQLCFCQAIGPGATLSWPSWAFSAAFATFRPLTSTALSLLRLRCDGRGELGGDPQLRPVPLIALACQAPPRPSCVCTRPISCTSNRRSAQSSVCVRACVCVS